MKFILTIIVFLFSTQSFAQVKDITLECAQLAYYQSWKKKWPEYTPESSPFYFNEKGENTYLWYWYLDGNTAFSYDVETDVLEPYIKKSDRGKLKITTYSFEWTWYANGDNSTNTKTLNRKTLEASIFKIFSDDSGGEDTKWQCKIVSFDKMINFHSARLKDILNDMKENKI